MEHQMIIAPPGTELIEMLVQDPSFSATQQARQQYPLNSLKAKKKGYEQYIAGWIEWLMIFNKFYSHAYGICKLTELTCRLFWKTSKWWSEVSGAEM